jgi:hypothetical protein
MSKDMVNSPAHYNQTELECIDAIKYALGEEGFVAYCRGNAIKYNWRAGHKINSVEDLNKAAWYCRMAAGDDPRKDPGYSKGAPKGSLGNVTLLCKHKNSNCSICGITNEIVVVDGEFVPPECDTRGSRAPGVR